MRKIRLVRFAPGCAARLLGPAPAVTPRFALSAAGCTSPFPDVVAGVAPSAPLPGSHGRRAPARAAGSGRVGPFECVALGTSTGGPVALATVLPKLPKNFPLPIIIVQHMPPGFTKPLAERLNGASSDLHYRRARTGMRLAERHGDHRACGPAADVTPSRIGGVDRDASRGRCARNHCTSPALISWLQRWVKRLRCGCARRYS